MSDKPTPPNSNAKPLARVSACALCQQRKIKCDRKSPCASCSRAGAQCVAIASPRQRRRRFPEKELLDRLRYYESLLRNHKIPFDPLHPSSSNPDAAVNAPSQNHISPGDVSRAATRSQAMNLWQAMSQTTLEDEPHGEDSESDSGYLGETDHVREAVIEKAWDQVYGSERHDHLLFGSPNINADLSSLHPEPGKIFKLWQIYLENVNPLLKVTHTPTLQACFSNAASDVTNTGPNLEALMFSIYCIAVLSLSDEDCMNLLGAPRKELLANYQFACQQALTTCRVLRSSDRECLTALYLYIVSIRPETDPRSLSSMLGVAIRIAQRMGIHNEASNATCAALEAEMRRRLWWSLVIFDNRICEMFDYRKATLAPTWDCHVPLNLSDFEVRSEMKALPTARTGPTDAMFAVVRSELADFLRYSAFHLHFINPSLHTMGADLNSSATQSSGDVNALAKRIEDNYLSQCNTENPLDFMTLWTARGHLARFRLLEHYFRHASTPQADTLRDLAISHALDMLNCDTQPMTSSLTQGYAWFAAFHFPFPAYIHVLQDLRKRPLGKHADKAWHVMSDNHAARMGGVKPKDRPFFVVFSRLVLHAWDAREAALKERTQSGLSSEELPRIVVEVRMQIMLMTTSFRAIENGAHRNDQTKQQQPAGVGEPSRFLRASDEFPMQTSVLMEFGGSAVGGGTNVWNQQMQYSEQTVPPIDANMEDFDWTTIDWTAIDWNAKQGYGR